MEVVPLSPLDSKREPSAVPLLEDADMERNELELLETPKGSGAKRRMAFDFLTRDRPPPSAKRNIAMLGTLFMVMILEGWNDGSQGPLIPFLQKYYKIDYLTMAITFIIGFAGSITAAVCNVWLTDTFGFGLVAPFGSCMQAAFYFIGGWGLPYPIFAAAFALNGIGFGLEDAQVNAMISRLPNASTKMFLLHGTFGVGALIAPLVSTTYIKTHPDDAYTYYFISFGVAVTTIMCLLFAFEGRTDDQVAGPRDKEEILGEEEKGSGAKLRAIFTNPMVHLLVAYSFIYVGVEISLGSWSTTFLMRARGGDLNSGYVTVGFFGGLAAGRMLLIPVTNYFGHRKSVLIYSVISFVAQIMVWVVPSLWVAALGITITGMAFGPMYPSAIMIITEVLPPDLHVGTIGLFGSLGGAGGAAVPFILGAVADKYGIWVMSPFMIVLIGMSIGIWALVARHKN